MLGMIPLAVLPLYIGSLVELQGFSEQQAGLTSTVNLVGNAFGVLFISLRSRPSSLYILFTAVALEIGFDLFSLGASYSSLLLFRLLAGFGGGILTGLAYKKLAQRRNPDREFAVLIFLQFFLGAIILYSLPMLITEMGVNSFYYFLVATTLLCGALGVFVIRIPDEVADVDSGPASSSMLPVCSAIIAIILFELAASGVWAFVERIGANWSLDQDKIAGYLSLGTLAGIAGSALVVLLSNRWGRFGPLLVGSVTAALCLLIFTKSKGSNGYYLLTLMIFNLAWAYTIPYLQGVLAGLDPSGRTAVFSLFCMLIAIAAGPYCFSLFLSGENQHQLAIYASSALFVSAFLFVAKTARQLDKATMKNQT